MKSLRILAFVHPELVPPHHTSLKKKENAEWKGEYDVVSTLRKRKHIAEAYGAPANLNAISRKLQTFKPDIVFNLLEEFDERSTYDQNVVSFLQLAGIPFTGNCPRGLMLARDKALSKKILAFHGIPVPEFQTFPRGRKIRPRSDLPYPMIVKSQMEEASLGISQSSVVHNEKQLVRRVRFVHASVETAAIAEKYVEGRELYVGVLGNHKLRTLSPWELIIRSPKKNSHFIATSHVKHSPAFQKRVHADIRRASKLSFEMCRRIEKISKDTYQALHLSGYARIDIRLARDGTPYVLEANPNPDISADEALASAARYDGIAYSELLEGILRSGLRRIDSD